MIRNDSTQVNEVEQGKTDWMQAPPPADRYQEVKNKYEGTQFRVESTVSTYYFWMNMKRAPFDDLKVREAVNYAIDPRALERIYAGSLAATHQILPPGMPGYEKFDLYPHDMAKAEGADRRSQPVRPRHHRLGRQRKPEQRSGPVLPGRAATSSASTPSSRKSTPTTTTRSSATCSTPDLDTGWFNWFEDYPHPNDFFQPLLSGESIAPTNNSNFSQTDIPELNEKITRLGEEPLGPKQEAEYAELDKEFMEHAPWAPYGTRTISTFVSSAIDLDKVIWNPTFEDDLTSFQFK